MVDDPYFGRGRSDRSAPKGGGRNGLSGDVLCCTLIGAAVGSASLVALQIRGPHDTIAGVVGAFLGAAFGRIVESAGLMIPLVIAACSGFLIGMVAPAFDQDYSFGTQAFGWVFLIFSVASVILPSLKLRRK